ncbi:MAG: VOC family protein [Planctomycetota bacterium]|nr:MAG: VOC family protein [Planctomycetota bacterium]
MSESKAPKIGTVGWIDLTVEDAPAIRDFYQQVVGWKALGLDMEGYQDFVMQAPQDEEAVSGICHARGPNEGFPSSWLIYITVAHLEQSLEKVLELGGQMLRPPRGAGGHGRFAVIQDPAGAVCALFEAAKD